MISYLILLALLVSPTFCVPVAKTRNGNLFGTQLPEAQAFFRYQVLFNFQLQIFTLPILLYRIGRVNFIHVFLWQKAMTK